MEGACVDTIVTPLVDIEAGTVIGGFFSLTLGVRMVIYRYHFCLKNFVNCDDRPVIMLLSLQTGESIVAGILVGTNVW